MLSANKICKASIAQEGFVRTNEEMDKKPSQVSFASK